MNTNKVRLFSTLGIIFLSFVIVVSCSPMFLPTREKGTVNISILIPSSTNSSKAEFSSRFIHPDTQKIKATVTGSDITTIIETKTLSPGNNKILFELNNIAAGKNRLITISLYDSTETLLAEGSTLMDVEPNVAQDASITVIPKKFTLLGTGVNAVIPALSGGKTFVYATDIPASGAYTVTLSTDQLKPDVYNSIGQKVSSIASGFSYNFTAVSAGLYYVVITVPTAFTDSASLSIGLYTTTVPSTAPLTLINLSVIPGVVAPVRGVAPVTTAIDTAQYTGTITWSPNHSLFAATTVYTANIVLTAKTGYTLTGVTANSFTVAGTTAVTYAMNTGIVAAVFPATFAAPILAMVNVPAGSFQRDSDPTNISTISTAFQMSTYEITRAQFLTVMGADPSSTISSSGTTDPVQMTNWYHAIAFCNKLSIAEGLVPVYAVSGIDFTTLIFSNIPTTINATWDAVTATWTNNGYRLPTEMEWLWAAMGATGTGTNTTGYQKAFAGDTGSNAIGDYAVYGYGSGTAGVTTTFRTNPVGSKIANELGLYDMTGNVWEWNWDLDDTYPAGAIIDYRGAVSGSSRVCRGADWLDNWGSCPLGIRNRFTPETQIDLYGFRVVRP